VRIIVFLSPIPVHTATYPPIAAILIASAGASYSLPDTVISVAFDLPAERRAQGDPLHALVAGTPLLRYH